MHAFLNTDPPLSVSYTQETRDNRMAGPDLDDSGLPDLIRYWEAKKGQPWSILGWDTTMEDQGCYKEASNGKPWLRSHCH